MKELTELFFRHFLRRPFSREPFLLYRSGRDENKTGPTFLLKGTKRPQECLAKSTDIIVPYALPSNCTALSVEKIVHRRLVDKASMSEESSVSVIAENFIRTAPLHCLLVPLRPLTVPSFSINGASTELASVLFYFII